MGKPSASPTTLHEDNNPVIKLMEGAITAPSRRTRHIELRWFWLREAITAGITKIVKIASKENIADIQTKALGKITFQYLRDKIVTDGTKMN